MSEYVADLIEGKVPPPTRCFDRSSQRPPPLFVLQKHLRLEDLVGDDPTAGLEGTPRRSKKLPNVLNQAEVTRLLAVPAGDSPQAYRDRAIPRSYVRLRTVGLRGDRPRDDRRRHLRGMLRARGKGSRKELCRLVDRRSTLWGYLLSGRPDLVMWGDPKGAFSQLSGPPPDQAGSLQDRAGACEIGWPRRPNEPSHPAPLLRHPPAPPVAVT